MKYIWNKSNQIFQKKTHFSHRPLAEASIIKCLFVFVCDICFAFCMSTTFLFVQSFSYFCTSATFLFVQIFFYFCTSTTHRGFNRRRDEPETLPPFVQELAEKWNGHFSVFFFCILQLNVHQCLPLFAPLDQSDEETWPEKKTKKKTRRGWDAYSFSAGAQWQIKLLSLLFYVLTHRQAVSTNENWNEILLHQCSVQKTSWNDTVMKHTTFSFPGRFSPLLWHIWQLCSVLTPKASFSPPAARPPNEINMWFGL